MLSLKDDWEDLARVDAFWAILSDPKKSLGRWDVAQFFLTGEKEIELVMNKAEELGYPQKRETALDFGCGVGRLTRALAKYFGQSYGVDISETMINGARRFNKSFSNCHFILNTEPNLRRFSVESFDTIYSNIVLQHLPTTKLIESYLSEFMRTLRVGGLLRFQLPSYIPVPYRIQPRRRLYTALRVMGFDAKLLVQTLKVTPIRMSFVPKRDVTNLLSSVGGHVLEIEEHRLAPTGIRTATYSVTKLGAT
jgi:ubiquinone/menaquinone biosynthesis C-methylase UbiE